MALFEQTLDDMQFIFVDDCSTDGSMEIVKEVLQRYPHRQSQTVLLRQECNQGVPSARKEGTRIAEGIYVINCDSDDYMEPDMYATLYQAAVRENADMVVCDFYQASENGCRQRQQTPSQEGDHVRDFLHGRLSPYLWCTFCRKELCQQVTFPKVNYLEDWVQIVQLYHHCKTLAMVHRPLYHYCYHKASVSHHTNAFNCMRQWKECMENYTLMHDYVEEHCPVGEDEFVEKKVLVRSKILPVLEKWGSGRWRNLYLSTFPEVNKRILFNPSLPKERKTEHLAVVMGMYPLMAGLRRWVRRLSPVHIDACAAQ